MSSAEPSALEVRDLRVGYPDPDGGRQEVLRVDRLDLPRGGTLAVRGESGSGKTTLLHAVAGILPVDHGTLRVMGERMDGRGEAARDLLRARHVGYLFQDSSLLPHLTALENVALVTDIAEKPMNPVKALEMVDLGNRLHHFPAQLSGGEQQRVAIARAVVKQPDVLLCDEPTGALDYATGKLVLEVLEKVNRELGTLTVVITHNVAIAGMADRVIRISSGEIVEIRVNERRLLPGELSW